MKKDNINRNTKIKTKIKYIIFDFDGTIADSLDYSFQLYKNIKDKYNLPTINKSKFKKTNYREIIKKYKISKLKTFLIYRRGKKIIKKDLYKIKPFPGIKEVLEELSKKYELYIISSNNKGIIKKFLKIYNLDKYFKNIYASVFRRKKYELLSRFIKKKNIKKEEIIYIGDLVSDIKTCKKISIKIISVTYGFNLKKDLIKHKPNYIINKPEMILKIL